MATAGKYDGEGFKLGPNGGIFADPNYNLSDPLDYKSWDWKQIKAAIVGYSAVPGGYVPQGTQSFADPESLRQASVVINRSRAGLEFLAENIRLQSEALAGENGAWKSDAADAFRSMTLLFAAKLKAKAEQINGGETVGTNNVPRQLWMSGNYLQWAQEAINWIDSYYASWVVTHGVTMNNGLARISDFPDVVKQMTDDMIKIVDTLVDQYVLHTNNVSPPNPGDFDVEPKPPDLNTDNTGGDPPPPPPNLDAPPPPGTEGGGPPPPDLNAPPPPPDLNAPPPPGTNGGSPPPPDLSVPPPPGGTGGGGPLPSPPSLNVPPPLGGTGGGGPLPSPPSLNVPPPPGTGGRGGTGSGIGVGKPPSLNVPPPTGTEDGAATGDNAADPALPDPAELPAPNSGSTGTGIGSAGLDRAGPPMMPPMMPPGMGGGQPGAAADRPDASGLLGGERKPWEADLAQPVGDLSTTRPPAVKPEEWAAAAPGAGLDRAGSPVMPPVMPPGMGGGQPGAAADRPDASGLLGGERKPWEADLAQPVGDLSTTRPPAVKPEEWAAAAPGAGLDRAGSPVMPPVMPPGIGGGQPGAAADRPDASGLLGGEKKPWEANTPQHVDGPSEVPPPSAKPEGWAADPGADAPGVQVPEGAVAPAGHLNETSPPSVDPVGTTPLGQQVPGGGMPMPIPPGNGMGGAEPGAADRPDSSGLLGGLNAPWSPGLADSGRIGGNSGVAQPSSKAEAWANTPGVPPEEVRPPEVPAAEVSARIDLTPAAAPAGWVASSDVAQPGVLPTAAPESAPSAGTGPLQQDGSDLDGEMDVDDERDEDRASGGPLPTGGEGPVPGVDSVVVVRPDESVHDTSAWDDGLMEFLVPGALMPLAVAKPAKPEKREPVAEHATYRRKKAGEAVPIVDSWSPPPSCGDEYSVPEDDREEYLASLVEPEEEETEETEPEERSAADLLNENDVAWGGSKTSKPTGVLE